MDQEGVTMDVVRQLREGNARDAVDTVLSVAIKEHLRGLITREDALKLSMEVRRTILAATLRGLASTLQLVAGDLEAK